MKHINIEEKGIGVNFTNPGLAQINVWAPKAKKLSLYLEHKDAALEMVSRQYGYWYLETDQLQPGDTYKFKIDDDQQLPDPASVFQPNGVHEASAAVDLAAMQWTDNNWKNRVKKPTLFTKYIPELLHPVVILKRCKPNCPI